MPEGPEIRKAADKVAQAILAKKIIRLKFGQPHLKKWQSSFTNMTVCSIDTYGKAMVTRFIDSTEVVKGVTKREALNIYTHNQLYGRWVICDANQAPSSNRQLRLGIYTKDKWALLYSASDIFVLTDEEVPKHPFIKRLGKDVLNAETTVEYVIDKLLSSTYRNRQIGGFLTEQSFLAGLGNYLRCDILFVAGIHPARKPSELTDLQILKLAKNILKLPRQSYQTESITNDLDAVKNLLAQGSSLENSRFWVFRREGLPCYRCDRKIIKKNTGGQPCYICEKCQK